jgi:phosphotransferase system, enzyme I, PtsP
MARAPGWTGARRLLKQLRDTLQQGGPARLRLDRVATLIANTMVAEVCSLYVMRAGEVLELFATQGLKPEAVHRTRLRVGEGLVGLIAGSAEPVALADAQGHPNFAYRPETGEEIFQSFMGVPVLREGRVIGVIVVQNKTQRQYTEEEVETLETVAMVLAELLISAGIIDPEEQRLVEGASLMPTRLTGIVLNAGLAMGTAVSHERGLVIRRLVAEDPEQERQRLKAALVELNAKLETLFSEGDLAHQGEHREVLETYRMFAEDRGWMARIEEIIASGLTAEAAVHRVQSDIQARMNQVTDPYLKERFFDLDDLANRLLHHLVGGESTAQSLPEEAVLIARHLGPAELIDYDRTKLKAVILTEGSPTAHVAIVARALDLPMLGRVPDALTQIRPGDTVAVDGDNGQVLVRPREGVRQSFRQAMDDRDRRRKLFAGTRDLPAVSRDGQRVQLSINAGLLIDVPQVVESGADGIGLYRTEVPFMTREAFPRVDEQEQLYRTVFEQAQGRPVVFRTLDIGGDKPLPYWSAGGEENPAMGWRAIRVGLDRPALLRQQLRALVRAAVGRHLFVMFPMVSHVGEYRQARALLERELKQAERRPDAVSVGVMLEVPALLFQLDELFAAVDFVSIGSNDLLQFLFACDRGNPRLAQRYEVTAAPVLRILKQLARQAEAAKVPLSLCGETAANPLEALALIGCGLRHLSMPPAAVAPVKIMVRSLDIANLSRFLEAALERDPFSLRELLRNYARDHGVAV